MPSTAAQFTLIMDYTTNHCAPNETYVPMEQITICKNNYFYVLKIFIHILEKLLRISRDFAKESSSFLFIVREVNKGP